MHGNYIENVLKKSKQKRLTRRIIAILNVFVLLFTMNSMKFHADTLERIATCGYEDHEHGMECYDEAGELICKRHVHTDACYQLSPAAEIPLEAVNGDMEPTDENGDDIADVEIPLEAVLSDLELTDETGDDTAAEDEMLDDASVRLEETEPEFTVGSAKRVLLSEILEATGLVVGHIENLGQVLDTADDRMYIEIEKLVDERSGVGSKVIDYAIYPLESFDEIEILITADGKNILVKLLNAVVAPETEFIEEGKEEPTKEPEITEEPTEESTSDPTETPEFTEEPSTEPTEEPENTEEATEEPTSEPTETPEFTEEPTVEPTEEPESTEEATEEPTAEPTETPEFTEEPTAEPTEEPESTEEPTEEPTTEPTETPEAAEEPAETIHPFAEDAMPEEHRAQTFALTIDLTGRELPVSLNALLREAEAMSAETVADSDATASETEDTAADIKEEEESDAPGEAEWQIEYDAELIAIESVDGDYQLTPLTSFDAATLIVRNGRTFELTLVNRAAKALNLGLAKVKYADGEGLPEGAEGHAELLTGDAAMDAQAMIESYLVSLTKLMLRKPARRMAADQMDVPKRQTLYKVFDISVEKVDERGFHVEVTLPEGIAGDDYKLYHIHEGKVLPFRDFEKTFEEDGAGGTLLTAFAFDTENFSLFVLSYTVDFHYNDTDVSIEGNTQVLLSTLIAQLNITDAEGRLIDVNDVAAVTFTDERLVTVEEVSGKAEVNGETVTINGRDFLLTSNEPFTSDERLVLTLIDAESDPIVVGVTDSQPTYDLADYVQEVTIKAPKNEQGHYVVKPNETYDITMKFGEDESRQFPDSGTLTYQLPDGLSAVTGEGDMTIVVKTSSGSYQIPNNHYSLDENGLLTLTFNDSDPNWSRVSASGNLSFTLIYQTQILENTTRIEFSEEVVKEVEVDTSNSVTASKVGNVDKQNNRIHYTVGIDSKGTSTNVNIKDTLTGTGLTLDASSIWATSSTGAAVTFSKSDVSGNSFDYTIPSMRDGEHITFTYSAIIDPSVLEMMNGRVVTIAGNSVKVESDGDKDNDPIPVTNVIDYTPDMSKGGGEIVSQDESGATQRWTITVNPNPVVSAAGTKVTDRIGANSQQYMTYSGGGITVLVKDQSGNTVRTDNIAWGDLNAYSPASWEYVIPSSDSEKTYSYEISYTTYADTSTMLKPTQMDNHAETDGGKTGDSQGQVVPVGYVDPNLTKTHTDVDVANREVTWQVSFVVPASGLSKAVLKDTYPARWVIDHNIYEPVKDGTLTVTGLTDNESYTLDTTTSSQYCLITFTKNGQPGMEGTGVPRTIVATLKTVLNDEWLQAAKAQSYLKNHTNTVVLDYGVETDPVSDTVSAIPSDIKKTASKAGTRDVDGTALPIYKYELLLTGVTDTDLVIQDTFDTSLLEPYPSNGSGDWKLAGGTVYWQGTVGDSKVSYVTTTDGIEFRTNSASMPMNNGSFFEAYLLTYYLTVKDAAALNRIMETAAASEDGKATIGNTVTWDGETSTANVTYDYNGLDKEILTPDNALNQTDEDINAQFRITVNPAGAQMNGGEPMQLLDSFENLSVDYSSILAEPPAGVTWDFNGNTATFTIPDETKVVITYRARVVFDTIGEMGDTIERRISNTATLKGYHDEIIKNTSRHNSAGGTAEVFSINLLKYEAGDMTHRLAGAQFQLLDQEKQPVTDKNGDPVIYTTEADGLIHVEGDQHEDGWTLYPNHKYYLREIKAPDGYMLMSYDPEFTISPDGTADYSRFIYFSGDTMSAKNYPGTDVKVEKKWVDQSGKDVTADQDSSASVLVKLQQRIQTDEDNEGNPIYGPWSDTIREKVGVTWMDTSGKNVTLNSGNDWKDVFKGLPLVVPEGSNFDGPDVAVDYRVLEIKVNGEELTEFKEGTKTGDGKYSFLVENVAQPGEGQLKISKTTLPVNATQEFTFTIAFTGDKANEMKGKSYSTEDKNGTAGSVTVGAYATATVTLKGGESIVIKGLPDGVAYTIEETPVTGWQNTARTGDTGTIAADETQEASFTNTELTKISAKKTWNDSETWKDGMSVTFQLKQDGDNITADAETYGAESPKTITSQQTVEWTNLPKYHMVGDEVTEYTYTVTETAVLNNGASVEFRTVYDVTGEGAGENGLVTINNTDKKTKVSVSKVWKDEVDTNRPDQIEYTLSAKAGETTLTYEQLGLVSEAAMKVTGAKTATPAYGAEWDDLPKYAADGTKITYTVTEGSVENYELVRTESFEGDDEWTWTFTNQALTEISVTKIWNGSETDWPEGVTVDVQWDGVPWPLPDSTDYSFDGGSGSYTRLTSETRTATKTALPVYATDEDGNAQKVEYSVKEIAINYNGARIEEDQISKYFDVVGRTLKTGSSTEYVIDNKLKTTEAEAKKKWEGQNGTEVTFTLKNGGTVVATVTLDGKAEETKTAIDGGGAWREDDAWHVQFTDLPKYEVVEQGGTKVLQEIAYTVEETAFKDAAGIAYTVEKTEDGYVVKQGETVVSSWTVSQADNTITNTAPGGLKIEKHVTYNGLTPSGSEQKSKLAGTYTFTIFTDDACKKPYLENGQPKTVSIIIDTTGASKSSDPITLPVGDYWIKEDDTTNGTVAVQNPVPVTVESGKTGDAAVIATVTNNYTDGPDELFIKVEKEFIGIDPKYIPNNFQITLTGSKGTSMTLNRSNATINGQTWSWKITGIKESETFTIAEENQNLSGYKVTSTGIGASQAVEAADISFEVIGNIETTCSHNDWPVAEGRLFAGSLTSAGGNHTASVIIITKESLSAAERKAIEEKLLPILKDEDANVWKKPIVYYSKEEHPNGFQLDGKKADSTVNYENDQVTFSATDIWQHVASVGYTRNDPASVDFEVTNAYTTSINAEKKWYAEGSQNPEDTPKDVSVTLTLKRYIVSSSSNPEDGNFTPKTVTITADADGNVTRTMDGVTETISVNDADYANAWKYTWDDLERFGKDASGNTVEYAYTVNESNFGEDYYRAEGENSGFLPTLNENGSIKENTQEFNNHKRSSYTLPETGGPGTAPVYATGVSLLVLAAIWFIRERKNRAEMD